MRVNCRPDNTIRLQARCGRVRISAGQRWGGAVCQYGIGGNAGPCGNQRPGVVGALNYIDLTLNNYRQRNTMLAAGRVLVTREHVGVAAHIFVIVSAP